MAFSAGHLYLMSWTTSFTQYLGLTRDRRSRQSAAHSPAGAGSAQFLLQQDQIRDPEALSTLVSAINGRGGTYHRLDLTPELRIAGDYDMRKYVAFYHIPEDLRGLRVLDVGTAAGYFALECARRGGEVVAIDVWDWTPVSDIARHTDMPVAYVRKSIYELDASFGSFDLVVCGSLLLHLPDPFGAILALRRVCRGRVCISTACPPDSERSVRPACDFVGAKGEDGDYYTYWQIGAAALRRMLLAAGFARIAHEGHFSLDSEEGRHPFATPHVAMSGFVS